MSGLDAGCITVLHDQRVTVGSPNNRRGAVLPGLRLVTAAVAPLPDAARHGARPVTYEVLTDRWDLTALDVVQVYLWRWQIELLFRWLKGHVRLVRLLGYSQNAVELTLYLSLIVHLVLVLLAHATGQRRRSPALQRQLMIAVFQVALSPFPSTAALPRQLPFPGWIPALPAQLTLSPDRIAPPCAP